ncbi:MAG: hypothetical protein ACLFR0_08760 [Alphaproteobacteria bacterium]
MTQILAFDKFANPAQTSAPKRIEGLLAQMKNHRSAKRGENSVHSVLANEAFDVMDGLIKESMDDAGAIDAAKMVQIADLTARLYDANIYSEETGRRAVLLKDHVKQIAQESGHKAALQVLEAGTSLNFSKLAAEGIGPQPEAEIYDDNHADVLVRLER